jgi:adiponectin receptor
MFVLMGLSAIAPICHGLRIYGIEQLRKTISLDWVVSQGVLYIVGACLYAARFPERVSPGTFDIWGSSHQIFHVFVVLAAATHLVGLVKAFDYEHSQRGDAVYLTFLHKMWPNHTAGGH